VGTVQRNTQREVCRLPRNREIADTLVIKRDARAAERLLAAYLDDAERQLLDVYTG
jgi:hypothetical protein